MSPCYALHLEPAITAWRPALWVRGLIHSLQDYDIGGTGTLANPLGRAEESRDFDANTVATAG